MVQEEKDLLLKELSSRYPYGVILHFDAKVEQDDEPLYSIRKNGGKYLINDAYYLEEVKPYLRPMESMTEGEKEEFIKFTSLSMHFFICKATDTGHWYNSYEEEDWLDAHHFDYRGLIKKGLAIEVSEKNNPYEN